MEGASCCKTYLCDVFKLIKRLLERFVKDDEIIKLTILIKLFKGNFPENFSRLNYHKVASAINVGFVVEQELKRLNLRKKISDLTLLTIKKTPKDFLLQLFKSSWKNVL